MMLPIDINIFPRKKGVYIVGGSIRDILCGRSPIDYDLVVQLDPDGFAKHLATMNSGKIVEFGKHGQKIRRVVTKHHLFDIMPVNGASIEDDLRQRDFTINAMAVDISSANLIDRMGGQQDLAAKKIRMVTSDVFRKDPVRLIRAYRIASSFGFTIDADTQAAIARDANFICNSAGERIREEFFKILQRAKSHVFLSQMADSGLLFSVFPELLKLKNNRLPIDAPCSLLEQTLSSYHHLEKLFDPGDQIKRAMAGRFIQESDAVHAALLKWAVLFHGIGKPTAQKPTGVGKTVHYYGHAPNSAVIAKKICQRMRFSIRQTETIEFLIRNHFRPFFLFNARQKKAQIQKAFIRFFMKCRDATPDVLLLALAEFRGKRVKDDPDMQEFTAFVFELIHQYYSVLRPRASLPLPLNGNDLINEFGLKPSPLFQRILRHVEAERLARKALTRKQAIKLADELLKQQKQ